MISLFMAAIATSETFKIRMETFRMQRESKDCFESESNFFSSPSYNLFLKFRT